jgi:uncharacterized protein with ParB-like and HNH nuclease domain
MNDKTLRKYLYQDGKQFVVPNYQRGYKWAVKENGNEPSHVERLCDNLITAYQENKPDYFLQGITVSEKDGQIILIDGQQRTTTLYLLLWCLDKSYIEKIKLIYDIRTQSRKYIENLQNKDFNYSNGSDDYQDIFYFKKAIEQIDKKIEDVKKSSKEDFYNYILDKVKIIYIKIDESKAVKTFTMMNGNKATMLPEELIKAEMLRKVSLPVKKQKEISTSVDENLAELKEIIAKDWETNAIRSRYAREWDKWLYWWNREDVKAFFNVSNPVGLLLEYSFIRQKIDDKPYTQKELGDIRKSFSFDGFKSLLSENHPKTTKEQFKRLHDLQKSFEDIFNKPKLHNYLKMSLLCSHDNDDKFEIINYFIGKKNDVDIKDDYAKWRLVGATHLEITDPSKSTSEETKESRAEEVLNQLSDKFVYGQCNDNAFKQLLRLNVEEDNQLKRKFDFTIWSERSLEHIFPKSKVYHIDKKDEQEIYLVGKDNDKEEYEETTDYADLLNRSDFGKDGSEHCIGNLVLLYKNENSRFGAQTFEQKKNIYFQAKGKFRSRHLLHSISVFSNSKWGVQEIQDNQNTFVDRFKQDYEL